MPLSPAARDDFSALLEDRRDLGLTREMPVIRQPDGWDAVERRFRDPDADPARAVGVLAAPQGDLALHRLLTAPYYAGALNAPYVGGIPGYSSAVFLRESMAAGALAVQEVLEPYGMRWLVMDGYRDDNGQAYLYRPFLAAAHTLNADLGFGLTSAQLETFTTRFVSKPASMKPPMADGSAVPPPHHQVGAWDGMLIWLPPAVRAQIEGLERRIESVHRSGGEVTTMADGDRLVLEALEIRRWNLVKDNAELVDVGCVYDDTASAAGLTHLAELARKGALPASMRDAHEVTTAQYWLMTEIAGTAPYAPEKYHHQPRWSQGGVQVLGGPYATVGAMRISDDQRRHAAHVDGLHARLASGENAAVTSLPVVERIAPTEEGLRAFAAEVAPTSARLRTAAFRDVRSHEGAVDLSAHLQRAAERAAAPRGPQAPNTSPDRQP